MSQLPDYSQTKAEHLVSQLTVMAAMHHSQGSPHMAGVMLESAKRLQRSTQLQSLVEPSHRPDAKPEQDATPIVAGGQGRDASAVMDSALAFLCGIALTAAVLVMVATFLA